MLLMAAAADAVEVSIIGVADGRAVLVIDKNKPKTLRVGEKTPEGVKLLAVHGDYAIVEVDGRRQKLVLGEAVSTEAGSSGRSSVTLISDGNGHFITTGTINGATVRLMVDTGASLVSMGSDDAKRAGINYLAGQKVSVSTANGVVAGYRIKIDQVRLGDIALTNIDGLVTADVEQPVVLLGMSFLGRLDMKREGDSLTLTRRY